MAYDPVYAKAYREKNKKRLDVLKREYRKKNKDKINAKKKGYRESNKEKLKKARDGYREENKDRISEVTQAYRENNQKSIKKYNKEYSKRPEIIERENNRKQLKRDSDPIFRLNNSLSFGVRYSLKNNNLSKNKRRWENLVGYKIEALKEHLENLFKEGMSWNNYGQWHIDHIIPLKFFKYDSTDDVEFKYCWSLYNLQPLWKKDNHCKNDKVIIWGEEVTSRSYGREV